MCPQTGLIPSEGYRIAIDMDEMEDPLKHIPTQHGCCPAVNNPVYKNSDLISLINNDYKHTMKI